jgi:GH25 family lysozyme M1 (1,4-beta-N-acetylmuramidase)
LHFVEEIAHKAEEAIHKGDKHMLSMQDISSYQGPKAPELVAKHEVLGIKATEGNFFLDPDFANNWHFAEQQEKQRVAYHLLHPSINGLQQANYFLDYIDHQGGIESGDLFALDHEEFDGLEPAAVDACAKEFIDHVNSQLKCDCWVYTYINFAQSGNCASLGKSPLWIADPSNPPGRPYVPAPWTEWIAHQFGIRKGIDADLVNVSDVSALTKYGALIGEPDPPPNTTIMTLTDGTADVRKDFHDATPIGTLKGQKIVAGSAILEFK